MNRATIVLLTALAGTTLPADDLPGPLTETPGDPITGQQVFVSRDAGHCVTCHRVAELDTPFQGNVGPELTGIGNRRSAAYIRSRIMDPTRANPDAVMPAYYRSEGLRQVAPGNRGETLLTAAQVEDLVAFLMTLDEPT